MRGLRMWKIELMENLLNKTYTSSVSFDKIV